MQFTLCCISVVACYYAFLILLRKKNGVFDPKYALLLTGAFFFIDACLKIKAIEWSDDTSEYMLISVYGGAIIWVLLWIIFSYYPPVAIPKIFNRHILKISNETNYHYLSILCVIFSFITLLFNLWLLLYYFDYDKDAAWHLFIGIVVAIFFYLFGGFVHAIQLWHYESQKKESKRSLKLLKTRRAPILFLRSFELDKHLILGKSFDEYICQNFSLSAQPIISLCDPDSFLPTGGSIKIQSYDDSWKEAITILFKICRAVVIFEGKSDGLHWEISHLKEFVTPDKLFVVTPPSRYRKIAWSRSVGNNSDVKFVLNHIWKKFAERFIKEGIVLPTENPQANHIYKFDSQWHAIGVGATYKGKELFDYILDNTSAYDMMECDYSIITEKMKEYELSLSLGKEEKSQLAKFLKWYFISAVIICVVILIL